MFLPKLSLLLLLFLLWTGLGQTTRVIMRLPDDQSFRLTNFANLTIQGVSQIDGVRLTPDLGDSLTVDKSTAQHKIRIDVNLMSGTLYSLTVNAGSKSHSLNLIVERIPADAISNAVFITGPATIMQTKLNSIASSTRLIYRLAINASTTEAAVQVKLQRTTKYLPLWEAYDWMWNETKGSGVILMPERCPISSNQMCRTRLTFPSGHPAVQQAEVELNRDDNFMGFNLKWEAQSVDEMHRESCGPSTCLNNGKCDKNYRGIGLRCICPSSPKNAPWGPRCEHPVRGYYHDRAVSDPNAFTRHWIGDLPHSAKTIELSFEFSGSQKDASDPPLFALSSSEDIDQPLIMISMKSVDKIQVKGRLLTYSIEWVVLNGLNPSKNNWNLMRIYGESDRIYFVLCGKNLDGVCYNKIAYKSDEEVNFRNLWIEIGKGLFGCVRSVTVNGYSVDLAAGKEFNAVSASLTTRSRVEKACIFQDQDCKANYPSEACGDHSVCYGNAMSNPTTSSARISCNCKCTGSMRKIFEKIDNKCADSADNTCIKKPWIISTKSDKEIKWTFKNKPLSLPSDSKMSIELEIRTWISDAHRMITAEIQTKNGKGSYRRNVMLRTGKLFLSVGNIEYSFPSVQINDGEWHTVSVATELNLLTLSIDGKSKTYSLLRNYANMNSLDLSVAIESSWLRNIRISEIYMSTSENYDFTEDRGNKIIPLLSDAAASELGTPPSVVPCSNTSCPASEECIPVWGNTLCVCPIGLTRNSINGCCFNGGPCISPEKNTNVSNKYQGPTTIEQPMSNYNYWVFTITGAVALAALVGIIVFLIIRKYCKNVENNSEKDTTKDVPPTVP